jgi:hypothetical protein
MNKITIKKANFFTRISSCFKNKKRIKKCNFENIDRSLEIVKRLEGFKINTPIILETKETNFIDKINIIKKLYNFILSKLKERKRKKLYILEQALFLEKKKQLKSDLEEKNKVSVDRIHDIMYSAVCNVDKSDNKYNGTSPGGLNIIMPNFDVIDEHNKSLNPNNPTLKEIIGNDNIESRYTLKKQARRVNQKYFEGESLGQKVKRLNKD